MKYLCYHDKFMPFLGKRTLIILFAFIIISHVAWFVHKNSKKESLNHGFLFHALVNAKIFM
jgi:hypothetical protein